MPRSRAADRRCAPRRPRPRAYGDSTPRRATTEASRGRWLPWARRPREGPAARALDGACRRWHAKKLAQFRGLRRKVCSIEESGRGTGVTSRGSVAWSNVAAGVATRANANGKLLDYQGFFLAVTVGFEPCNVWASPRLHSISNPALACNQAGVDLSEPALSCTRSPHLFTPPTNGSSGHGNAIASVMTVLWPSERHPARVRRRRAASLQRRRAAPIRGSPPSRCSRGGRRQ